MKRIQIYTVGGTIDKVYFDAKSTYQVGPPNIGTILDELNVNLEYDLESLLRKDSLEMNDDDRALIRQRVIETPNAHILITHGTDTMVATAKSLLDIAGKIIVMTGAMEPGLFKTSDAVFNIGCAVAAVQACQPGVYITMNGRIFNPLHVRKNVEKGRFEEV